MAEAAARQLSIVQPQERQHHLLPWQLPQPRYFVPVSRPDSLAVDLERLNENLAAEDAVMAYVEGEERIPLAPDFPNVQPHDVPVVEQAEANRNQDIPNAGIMFSQPPLPPPPITDNPQRTPP